MSENTYKEELFVRYFLDEISEEELHELSQLISDSSEDKDLLFRLKQLSDSARRYVWSETDKEESWQRLLTRANLSADSKKFGQNLLLQPEKAPELPVRNHAGSGSATNASMPSKLNVRHFHLNVLFKYAAVILVALGIGWGIHELADRGTSPGAFRKTAVVYNEISVEPGGRGNTLTLSDGSKVTLNAATTFRYPADFEKAERTVYLDGEAWFDVVKNDAKPFVVKLKQQDITVLGTSFNVEAYNDEAYNIVTLLNGSVSLDVYNETGESISRMFLKPNQRAVVDNVSGSVSIQNMDTTLLGARMKERYRFKDEPLELIANRLEKYYGVKVHIGEASLRQIKFTGSFSKEQNIEEILHVLKQEKLYTVTYRNKEIFIVKKQKK